MWTYWGHLTDKTKCSLGSWVSGSWEKGKEIISGCFFFFFLLPRGHMAGKYTGKCPGERNSLIVLATSRHVWSPSWYCCPDNYWVTVALGCFFGALRIILQSSLGCHILLLGHLAEGRNVYLHGGCWNSRGSIDASLPLTAYTVWPCMLILSSTTHFLLCIEWSQDSHDVIN